ncbi:uncharacterized protein FSUBG_12002 [Fusarium subglutinans]|uniref:Uncharacterized protein n=1 Tax=Gibberella subglutinans TaxID=42677 RepID=A0A8H5P0W2_GIBSU|nr:uncharacterized protein FSUBG_12002 [Fusarium subglutinans]KAF5586791.1 hypothetical protein FSUBG_12002 [Fusarium subglutinans]
MPETRANSQDKRPVGVGIRFVPHDGSDGVQVCHAIFVFAPDSNMFQRRTRLRISVAGWNIHLHQRDIPAAYAMQHSGNLQNDIVAAFTEVEKTMPLELAVKLKKAVMDTWVAIRTAGPLDRAKVSSQPPYLRLIGTGYFNKELYYPDWFFVAVWLGPGHPFLESIRKDMSDLWGVQFPTDAIIYPKSIPVETQMQLFYGKPVTTPNEDSIEKRAKAIKKTIDESPVNGLTAAIKSHLQHDLKGDTTRMHELEKSLASTNRELDEAKKYVSNLEKQLAESKASQARASTEQEKTKSDVETLQKEMNALRSEVAQSAEKAEKAVETGALVLSVLSTPGGQKRKMDEIS